MLSISLVSRLPSRLRLFLSIDGHHGLPVLHLYWLAKAAAAAVINFFTAGFVDRTRLAIRPLQRCVLVVFVGLGGSV